MRKHLRLMAVITAMAMTFSLAACGKKGPDEPGEEPPQLDTVSIIGDTEESTLRLSYNGTLIEIAVEDFSDTDIDTKAIEDYVNNEINDYNKSNGSSTVSLLAYEQDGDVVKTAIQYSGIDAYNDFNGTDIKITLYNEDTVDAIAKAEAEAAAEKAAASASSVEVTEINEEELLEAGYDLSDLEQIEEEAGVIDVASASDAVATLTDAATGTVYESSEITDNSLMMIVTNYAYNFEITGGNVLYTNRHAELINENTAKAGTDGTAVIIYQFNY